MTNFELIQETLQRLANFRKHFATVLPDSPDERAMAERLTEIVAFVRRARTVDNNFLIELERFHHSFVVLVGLSTSKLTEASLEDWKAYDKFHYEEIKTRLSLYGTAFGF